MNIKFPSIPHYADARFKKMLGYNLIFTEKLDGLNVCLYDGAAYARDNSGAAHNAGYMAMVKKWAAPKTYDDRERLIYGEDLYAQHSCQYDPIHEDDTFRIFSILSSNTSYPFIQSWDETRDIAYNMRLNTVPVLDERMIYSARHLRETVDELMQEPSRLGGEKEGLVVRVAGPFFLKYINECIFKVVRPDHVQDNAEHWRKGWKPREIIWRKKE